MINISKMNREKLRQLSKINKKRQGERDLERHANVIVLFNRILVTTKGMVTSIYTVVTGSIIYKYVLS